MESEMLLYFIKALMSSKAEAGTSLWCFTGGQSDLSRVAPSLAGMSLQADTHCDTSTRTLG